MRPETADRGLVGGRKQGDRFRVMADLPADGDEDRLILLDRTDQVLAGDVDGGHDHDLGPVHVRVQLDADEARPRLGGSDGRAVPRAGEDEIVGVFSGAGQLGRSLAAQGIPSGATGYRRTSFEDEGVEDGPLRRHGWAWHRAGRHRTMGSSGLGLLPLDAERITTRRADDLAQSRPRRRARPGVAPVWIPFSTTGTPATIT